MIVKANNINDCNVCDEFLTLLIQDERKFDNTIDENFVVSNYFINMLNGQNILLLYKKENTPIGYIFAKKINDKYLIDGLYIDINFRNNGIATKLIKEIIREIYLFGDYEIFINVLKKNKVAVNLYKNNGFIVEQEDELKFCMCYNKYKLENASIKDIERIKKYKLNTIFEYAKDLDNEEVEKINNYVNKTISKQICEYKNIVLNNIVVGSFLITKNENGLLLDEIFIEEQYRNKGIGTSIIKSVISNANNNVYLWVYKDNIKAIKLYKKLGFLIKEETDSRYYMEYRVVIKNRKLGRLMDINKIKNELIKQKESKFKGNIYHYSQVNFAYNSNKIEGSRLTSEQTEAIFDTSSFIPKSDDLIKLDDLTESKNHFKLFDYMLDNVDELLTKDMIIEMNKILKRNTSDEENPRYNVGGFKVVPNIIGVVNVINTTAPEDVEKEIEELLNEYNSKTNITLEDIVDFHFRFERIHPFGDGNGRVGRIIMFKECLKNNIMPFIVLDDDKPYYMRGLKEYENDKMFLIDTIGHEQDLYEKMCEELLDFEIEENN